MKAILLMIWLTGMMIGELRYQDETTPPQEVGKSLTDTLTETGKEVGKKLDESPKAQEISAGILSPIYKLAENMAAPWFYWAAFALFAAGVVSYALQLVLTKLALLAQLKFNLAEILSDAMGLLISLVGLVLTTQAATENSTFTASPAMVLSAAAAGLVAGFLFFRWGHKLEVRAAKANQAVQNPSSAKRPM
ncbi:MAG: hypothetical protein KF851_18430 [Pirellulaceae bacterium]|nr:hypothetical protein [Pirellulaceae bacterium]